jgi:hypothetical protein
MTHLPAFIPRSSARAALLTLTVVLVAGPVRAQVPKTLTDLPLYPGATPAERLESEECGVPGTRLYVVKRLIEDVSSFYQERLSPRESDVTRVSSEQDIMAKAEASSAADDRYADAKERLKPGETTPVFLQLFTTTYATPEMPRALRDLYKAGRAPNRAGEWLAQAVFRWAYQSPRSASGEVTELSLLLADVVAFGHQTRICYTVAAP